jgi:hypothetical protein
VATLRSISDLGPDAPVHTFDQVVASRTAVPEVQAVLEQELAIVDGLNNPQYKDRTLDYLRGYQHRLNGDSDTT